MNGPKSVKRRSQLQKLRDRRIHLIRHHRVKSMDAWQYSYFQCGMAHMMAHLKRSIEEAKRHNA